MLGTVKRSGGAHLDSKACKVETRENAKARAKVAFRRVTGSILGAHGHDESESFVTVFSHGANDNNIGLT